MEEGTLAGTSSEREPGVGGSGDHPAPAAMRDADGRLHVAGEPMWAASGEAPVGDSFELAAGDVTDPGARERLNAVSEPPPLHIDRPDIGTP